jgi:hypothetical protein
MILMQKVLTRQSSAEQEDAEARDNSSRLSAGVAEAMELGSEPW